MLPRLIINLSISAPILHVHDATVHAAATMQVAFAIPSSLPVTKHNLNWTGPGLLFLLASLLVWWWLPRVGARHWYKGCRGATAGQQI